MNLPLRNIVYEKIKQANSITDADLSKALNKEGFDITADKFNKILLDLEILGLVRVSWLNKDTKRLEVIDEQDEEDEVERQNKEAMEKDYEAGFPGID